MSGCGIEGFGFEAAEDNRRNFARPEIQQVATAAELALVA
jgi:hypothetical protein